MDQASRAASLIQSGKYKSIRQAHLATGAPRSTIQYRLAGHEPRKKAPQKHRRLDPYQEEILVKYIQDTQLQYAPINYTQLAVVAQAMAQEKEPGARLGKNWITRFLRRHEEIRKARNRALESSRITAAIPSMIEGWFSQLSHVINRFKIPPDNI